MKAGDKYMCEICKGEYETDWSHDEALQEACNLHGEPVQLADMMIVCDDCYTKVRQEMSVHSN